ncbi:hypothetical protein K030075H31_29100 [Blautia producta]
MAPPIIITRQNMVADYFTALQTSLCGILAYNSTGMFVRQYNLENFTKNLFNLFTFSKSAS